MLNYLFMKAKCEVANKKLWTKSCVSQALYDYFTDDVCKSIVVKTELKNRFLSHCKIIVRSGIWFLKLEEMTMPFKSGYCCNQNKWKNKRKAFSFPKALGRGGPVRCCCSEFPSVTLIFRSCGHFFFASYCRPSLIHKQAALCQLCPICWIPVSILSWREVLKAEVLLVM